MGLFSRFFRKPNPTEHWIENPKAPLVVDLGKHTIASVEIGGSIEALSFLGRGRCEGETCVWAHRGVSIDIEGSSLSSFHILFRPGPADPDLAPYDGRFARGGNELPAERLSTEASFVRTLGAPYWRDEDEEEILLFYEHGRVEWQVEFARNGGLRSIWFVSPPLMSDPEQRRAYRVTRPWPPRE